MKDTLIAFETAKLAKAKGFDIRSDIFYSEKYGLCQEGEESLMIFSHPVSNKYEYIYDVNSEFNEGERFLAPTQSLLQKWLREKHQLNLSVSFYDDGKSKYWTCRLHDGSDTQRYICGKDIYEDALEIGLVEALKSINQ